MPPRALALAVLFISSTPAFAQPPAITEVSPLGLVRGTAIELTIAGANLAESPTLLAPFAFTAEPVAAEAGSWRVKVTVAADTPIGVYPIRVVTPSGVSAPFLLAIDTVAAVAEVEPNNAFAEAKPITPPTIVDGRCGGTDVDFFAFAGKAGQRLVIDAQSQRINGGIDPQIRLTTSKHRFIASADDTPGLLTDSRMIVTLPEDGDYVLELSDTKYQGAGRTAYRLVVADVPTAEEVFPLGGRRGEQVAFELRGGTIADVANVNQTLNPPPTLERVGVPGDARINAPLIVGNHPEVREPAERAAAPAVFNGRLEAAGDSDKFIATVEAGKPYRVEVQAADFGSKLDAQVSITKVDGSGLASGDDVTYDATGRDRRLAGQTSPDPVVDVNVPGDVTEIAVTISDLQGRGGVGFPYRIVVEPAPPRVELRPNQTQISIPKGGHAQLGVTLVRLGDNGPIEVNVADPPAGLIVRPAAIAEGQATGVLSLGLAPDGQLGPGPLRLVAKGANNVIYPAAVLYVHQPAAAGLSRADYLADVIAAPAKPDDVAVNVGAGPIEVPHGGGVPIPLALARAAESNGELTLGVAVAPPAGLTVAEAKVAPTDAQGAVTVSALPPIPLGSTTIGLIAKGNIKGRDQVFAGPVVRVEVVRPFALTLAAPGVMVKPGQSVELKGRVERKAGFGQPVSLRLDGLPAGTKADPVALPADKADFTFAIQAEPTAAAAQVKPNVIVDLKLNNMDYASPPTPFDFQVVP